MECSRLLQSFSEKVKGGMKSGLQFKQAEKVDPLKNFTKERSPDLYEKFYGK